MKKEKMVTFSQEKMCSIGKRVKECRKNAGMTQDQVVDAILSLPGNRDKSRNPKQLSAIENGRRELSPEYAHLLAKVLHVRYEYLMGEDDYRTEDMLQKKYLRTWDRSNNLFLELLSVAGYEPVCDFITNAETLGIDKIYGPFRKNATIICDIPEELISKLEISTEILAPNGKTFYCDSIDFQLLEYELIEFIRLRMKQIESKHAWLYDDAFIKKRVFGTETRYYTPFNHAITHPDYQNGLWTDHNDEFFPSMNREYSQTEKK